MMVIGGFLFATASDTIESRKSRTPLAEVVLNPTAYADTQEAVAEKVESQQEIEKDLPPSLTDTSETIEVAPVETRTPLFSEDEEEVADIAGDDEERDTESDDLATSKEEKAILSSELPPRIALIISDMGLSDTATKAAIDDLPKAITLAFAPYAKDLKTWIEQARRRGHDVLLSIPMEPTTFPRDDPGPNALLTSLPDEENIQRLDWALSQSSGYVGIVNFMGSRFTSNQEKLSPVMDHLKEKDILILDSGSGADSLIPSMARINNIPYARNDRFIDNKATANAIDEQLLALENIALTRGQAIGIGFPYPITYERLSVWTKQLEEKGILLVPVSDIVSRK